MAISKGYRFPVSFDDAFPQGLVMVGEVMPDTEYQTRDERAAGRPVRQRVDEATGKRQWKVTVTDPAPSAFTVRYDLADLRDMVAQWAPQTKRRFTLDELEDVADGPTAAGARER